MKDASGTADRVPAFTAAEVGALAHLYRGEVYRSTLWRTRLDNTTNWAVVTTGIALSLTFANPYASPLPMILVSVLTLVFLVFEARRYRYFNVWRARARKLENEFYAPMLLRQENVFQNEWNEVLAHDYVAPSHHISFARAVGRRLRRSYGWILGIQLLAYYGKLAIHPIAIQSIGDIWKRAAVGPIPGELVVAAGLVLNVGWIAFAVITYLQDRRDRQTRRSRVAMG